MRKALIVGIDHYAHIGGLSGCVNDAYSVKSKLEYHGDGTLNFPAPQLMVGTGSERPVTRQNIRDAVQQLFADDAEVALFYFAGHGYLDSTGGFICGSDCATGDDGLSLHEVVQLANRSSAKSKVIILDSCHGGATAQRPAPDTISEIAEGVTILTASTADQSAYEVPGGDAGVFTSLLLDALGGAAANLVGEISPGSVYAHIDQSLGPWDQRPVFKTNVKSFISLRKVDPPIDREDLRSLTTHFPTLDYKYPLDPSFEPERNGGEDPSLPQPDPVHAVVFRTLQSCERVNLIRPVGAPFMWHAAMESKECELTALGQHYWRLVKRGLI